MKFSDVSPYLPLLGTLITGLMGLCGLYFVAYKNNKWAERNRKLDLYKIAYPEKVKAAIALTNLAASLFDKTGRYWQQGRIQNAEVVKELRADAAELHAMSISCEWLLGERVGD